MPSKWETISSNPRTTRKKHIPFLINFIITFIKKKKILTPFSDIYSFNNLVLELSFINLMQPNQVAQCPSRFRKQIPGTVPLVVLLLCIGASVSLCSLLFVLIQEAFPGQANLKTPTHLSLSSFTAYNLLRKIRA
jgi:hypothetical protein